MTWARSSWLALAILSVFPGAARAQCPTAAPAHDVSYSCPYEAPFVTYIGVCQPDEGSGNRQYCSPSCTVCFCGDSFSSVHACPGADGGSTYVDNQPRSCSASPGRARSPIAALTFLTLCAAFVRRRRC